MITLQKLRYFEKVFQLNSMTEAAKVMCVSQSSISQAIKELEDYFQNDLFTRKQGGIVPTDLGYKVSKEIRGIEKHFKRLDEVRYIKQNLIAGNVRVSISDMGFSLCMKLLSDFRRIYPNIHVSVIHEEWSANQYSILNNKVDLAICATSGDTHEDIKSDTLFTSPRVLYTHVDNPLYGKSYVTSSDLQEYELFLYEFDLTINDFKQYINRLKLNSKQVHLIHSREMMFNIVGLNIGVCILSEYTFNLYNPIQEDLANRVKYKRIIPTPPPVYMNLIWKDTHESADILRHFLMSQTQ